MDFLAIFLFIFLFSKKTRVFAAFLLFIFFLFNFQLFSLQDKKTRALEALQEGSGQQDEFVLTVLSVEDRLYKHIVYAELSEGGTVLNVKLTCYKCFDVEPGWRIKARLNLEQAKDFSDKFSYLNYLKARNIDFVGFIYAYEFIEIEKPILNYLHKIKKFFVERIEKVFVYERAALASGILLGEKQALPKDLQKDFSVSGLTHIVVLSGFNISILVSFVYAILFFLNKKLRAFIAILCISLFAVIVGADAPTLRATIMGSLALLALAFGRSAHALVWLLYAFCL